MIAAEIANDPLSPPRRIGGKPLQLSGVAGHL